MMIWEVALLIVVISICAYIVIHRICTCSERNHKMEASNKFIEQFIKEYRKDKEDE